MDTIQIVNIIIGLMNLGILFFVVLKLSKVEDTKAEKRDTDELQTKINKFQTAVEKHFDDTGKLLHVLKERGSGAGGEGFIRDIIEYFEIYYAHYRICQNFSGSESLKLSDRYVAFRESFSSLMYSDRISS